VFIGGVIKPHQLARVLVYLGRGLTDIESTPLTATMEVSRPHGSQQGAWSWAASAWPDRLAMLIW